MKLNQRRKLAQVTLFSLMALGAGSAFAQTERGTPGLPSPSGQPGIKAQAAGEQTSAEKATGNARGSEDTKENAIALINKAVDKSKRTSEFTKALENKDNKSLTKIVITNGAPLDSTVTVYPNPGNPGLSIECCSKKSWGPVIIKL